MNCTVACSFSLFLLPTPTAVMPKGCLAAWDFDRIQSNTDQSHCRLHMVLREISRCWWSHPCQTVSTTALLCLEVPQHDDKASSKKLKNSWLSARWRNAQVCGPTTANKNRQEWFLQKALLKSGWILYCWGLVEFFRYWLADTHTHPMNCGRVSVSFRPD